MTYDCLLEREAWLGGGGAGGAYPGGGGGLRRGDAAPYIGFHSSLVIKALCYITWLGPGVQIL